MRTTVVLRDDLVKKAKKLSGQRTLSGLLNACLAGWISQHSRKALSARLVEEYHSGRQGSRRASREFATVDKEGWPSRLWQDPEALEAIRASMNDSKKGRKLRLSGIPKVSRILASARKKGLLRR